MKSALRYGVAAMTLTASALAFAAEAPRLLSAAQSDPVALKLMEGFPPSPDRLVTYQNMSQFPSSRWGFHHMREVVPTKNVWRGPGDNVKRLQTQSLDLGALAFDDGSGESTTLEQWLKATYTDGFLVLHEGRVVYEQYASGMRPRDQHILWSVTKSFTGLLAADLVARGDLDPAALVSRYIPELKDSAWGDATVQQVMDMTAAVRYREDYKDFNSDVYRYAFAAGIVPAPKNYQGPGSLYEFLPTLTEKDGKHGDKFTYRTVHSEVLGWIITRAANQDFNELLSERVWQKLGAEYDAYAWVDSHGTAIMGAGMNVTLRDLGRFADMVRQRGRYNGVRIIQESAIDELFKGGDPDKFAGQGMDFRKGYSYHDQWYATHNANGAIQASGIYGQLIHIDPKAQVTVVKLSSHPVASAGYTHTSTTAALNAIVDALR